jgi:predicted Zn-dependent protease
MLSDAPGIYFSIGIGDLKRLLRTPQLLVVPFSQWAADTKTDDNKADSDLKAVRGLIDEKKYADARTRLQALLATHPNDSALHSLMGKVADDLGDIKTALTEFQKAISLDPKDASAHVQYSVCQQVSSQ